MTIQDIDEIGLHARHCQRMADSTRNEQDKQRWQMLADKWRQMLVNIGKIAGSGPSTEPQA